MIFDIAKAVNKLINLDLTSVSAVILLVSARLGSGVSGESDEH